MVYQIGHSVLGLIVQLILPSRNKHKRVIWKKKKSILVIFRLDIYIYIYIKQIEDQVIKAQRLSKFHKTLVRETCKPELRIQEPKVDLEKIYNRFTKSKKEVTVNDLQKEIKKTKFEVRSLKQELTILRVDHNFLDQRLKHLVTRPHSYQLFW